MRGRGMATLRLADLRNIYNADTTKESGFALYDSVGRACPG